MKRALHDLSHDKLATFNMGELVPLTVYEGLPYDIIRGSSSALIRTQPQLAPTMHKVKVSIFSFAVPLRLIWNDWEDFRTGGPTGENNSVYPTITAPAVGGFAIGSLADYLGLPTGVNSLEVSALPFRAYALIWNEYFRDKDLQPELVISKSSGADTTTSTTLQNGCWEKDYYTAARPEPQLGDPVSIPLTGDAPVLGIGKLNQNFPTTGITVYESDGTSSTYARSAQIDALTVDKTFHIEGTGATNAYPNIRADMSDVTAVNIENLRLASAIQRFKELLSKFGHTLPEFYRLFGVKPQDSRMQWPEYLAGGSSTIQFSEVLQTAEGTDPVGELRGHGIGVNKQNRFKYFIQEDCLILTLMCARPQTVYMQGMQPLWNRRSRWDFFMPALQCLGQQPILNKEINAAHAQPNDTFAWKDQYAEYKYIPNSVSGEFRGTLNFWHMARELPADVALNADFVKCIPTDRTFATNADQLQVRAMHKIKAKRLVYKSSKPRLM